MTEILNNAWTTAYNRMMDSDRNGDDYAVSYWRARLDAIEQLQREAEKAGL